MKINLREVVIAILIFVVVFAAVQISIGSYKVEMNSMDPTFKPKDCIMVDKLTYRFRGPHRGEVVILWPPKDKVYTNNPYIKRVIGLPGETIEIRDGQIYIKGKNSSEFRKLEEELPGVSETPKCRTDGRWEIPKGHYFVLGDNRDESSDSTSWGTVPRENFIGKTWLRYWPMSRFGLTPHYSFELVASAGSAPARLGALAAASSPVLSALTS
ncbi:MAG: signal peptidase I [Dehalococcoidia bacterium]|nr:signal peptidase I [Dehalococcoidia bacterium]